MTSASSSTAAAGPSSSSASLRPPISTALPRRQSLFGTDDRVVLDVGSRWTKVGFSGEAQPRKVFKTLSVCHSYDLDDDEDVDDDLLWNLDFYHDCQTSEDFAEREDLLRARLTVLLRHVYHKILLVDASTRKVILIINPFVPAIIHKTIASVLFDNLRVTYVAPAPTASMALFGVGATTGLVVHVGIEESWFMPVYEGRELNSYWRSSKRGAKSVEGRLRGLLPRYGRVIEQVSPQATGRDVRQRTRRLRREEITSQLLEEVLVRCCFVGDCIGSQPSQQPRQPTPPRSRPIRRRDLPPDWQMPHTGDQDSIDALRENLSSFTLDEDSDRLVALKRRYEQQSTANYLLLPLPSPPIKTTRLPTEPVTILSRSSTSRSTLAAPTATAGHLLIPGWLRGRVAEQLFEDSDDNLDAVGSSSIATDLEGGESSLTTSTLLTLLSLPIDLRLVMASRVLVTGGMASLPGLANRLRKELVIKLQDLEATDTTKEVALSTTRTGMRSSSASGSPHGHLFAPLRGLRNKIAVLNDSSPIEQGSATTGGSVASSTVLSPMLYSWFGASLVGAMKIELRGSVKREEHDAGVSFPVPIPLPPVAPSKAAVRDKEKPSKSRPGAATKGRGSYLGGALGGLDTGVHGDWKLSVDI